MDFNSAALGIGDIARSQASNIPVAHLKSGVEAGLKQSLKSSYGLDNSPKMTFGFGG